MKIIGIKITNTITCQHLCLWESPEVIDTCLHDSFSAHFLTILEILHIHKQQKKEMVDGVGCGESQ